jgi:diaminopimelate decarboxylase
MFLARRLSEVDLGGNLGSEHTLRLIEVSIREAAEMIDRVIALTFELIHEPGKGIITTIDGHFR